MIRSCDSAARAPVTKGSTQPMSASSPYPRPGITHRARSGVENSPAGTHVGLERHGHVVGDVDDRVDQPANSPVHVEVGGTAYRRKEPVEVPPRAVDGHVGGGLMDRRDPGQRAGIVHVREDLGRAAVRHDEQCRAAAGVRRAVVELRIGRGLVARRRGAVEPTGAVVLPAHRVPGVREPRAHTPAAGFAARRSADGHLTLEPEIARSFEPPRGGGIDHQRLEERRGFVGCRGSKHPKPDTTGKLRLVVRNGEVELLHSIADCHTIHRRNRRGAHHTELCLDARVTSHFEIVEPQRERTRLARLNDRGSEFTHEPDHPAVSRLCRTTERAVGGVERRGADHGVHRHAVATDHVSHQIRRDLLVAWRRRRNDRLGDPGRLEAGRTRDQRVHVKRRD